MHLVRSLVALCSVATLVVQARIDAVVSRALYIGTDSSDPTDRPYEIFHDPRNHPTAVASLLFHFSEGADFHPKEQGIDATSKAYGKFIGSVLSFPGFRRHPKESDLDLSGSLDQFRDEIASKYDPDDRTKSDDISYEFEWQLPKTLATSQEQWLLSLATITRTADDAIVVDLSSIPVKLTKDDYGSVTIDKQATVLRQQIVRVDAEFLIRHAEPLRRSVDIISVERFTREFFTKPVEEAKSESSRMRTLYPLSQMEVRP
ncbi:hypothetical protein B0O80DRAFT_499785 [Mortierella sp. GBAus27b]|nr:hypothetical protein BGX31_002447 [Mortierella sp. GBA43]KAI8351868.1 hypothetical protein B0O80DRAFT_499785 [Mortierella sp. GBAus27b]